MHRIGSSPPWAVREAVADAYDEVLPFFSTFAARFDQRIVWPNPPGATLQEDGRAEETPSMVVTDTHLARGAPHGGFAFHDRGGPYGRTKGAKRVVAST